MIGRRMTANSAPRAKLRGEFLNSRALLIVGILVAVLVVPLYLMKGRDNKDDAKRKAEAHASRIAKTSAVPPARAASSRLRGPVAGAGTSPANTTAAALPLAPPGAQGIGHGLTYGLEEGALVQTGDPVALQCRASGAPLDQPGQGGCNPQKGDTSCRMVLPVLCIRPGQISTAAGAAPGFGTSPIGATQPVMGAVLESDAFASARCEKELGPGWRAADTQDAGAGTLRGTRDSGLSLTGRYWLHAKGANRGNCWSSGS